MMRRLGFLISVSVSALGLASGAHAQTQGAAAPPPQPSATPPAPPASAPPPSGTTPFYGDQPASAPGTPQPPPAGAPGEPAPEQPPVAGPASEAAPPGIYVEQPPLPPLEPRTRHYHDGFYLRLSLGYGALDVASSADKSSAKASVSGGGPALDVLVGGTPAPGLVIGGGILTQLAFKPSVSTSGATLDGIARTSSDRLGLLLIGPMIDAFPNPTGGFHFGGLLGLAQLGLKDDSGNSSGGLGLSAWLGYMWWASSQWSLGGLLRLSAVGTARTVGNTAQYDVADTTLAFTAMFSAAYH